MHTITQWVKAALDANLTPSQQTIFMVVLLQTAGFGKVEDDLADSRLENLSGLRRDRAKAAITGLADSGLVEIKGKGKYGTVYRIPTRFLGDGACGRVPLPALKHPMPDPVQASEPDSRDDGQHISHRYQQLLEAHQALLTTHQQVVGTNQQLVSANQNLANAYQKLVETHQNSGNGLPKSGDEATKIRGTAYPNPVTNNNKPKHNKTLTTLNPDNRGEDPECREDKGEGDSFQDWGQCAVDAVVQVTPDTQGSRITAEALQYPDTLTMEERAEAPKKLDGLHPQLAQEVLDALAWKMANGEVKKSNIGLLVWLANSARTGAFDRTPALEWRKAQQSAQAKENAISVVELNNLAIEIKNIQRLHKESGEEVFFKQAEAMKATYFEKLAVYRANLVVQKEFTHA